MSIVFQRKATHGGQLVMRPGVLAAAAITGLGLICGGAQATRLTYPTADNPYCNVPTYALRDVPEQAMSTLDSNGTPVIVVSSIALRDKPAYGRFLLAHECCHPPLRPLPLAHTRC